MSGEVKTIGYRERADLYEFEYVETGDHAFLAQLTASPVRSVLEIPCGVGRNTLHLARPGLRFVAVDLEANMVVRLRDRTRGNARFADLEVIVGDMRRLSLDESFERIVVQREAFQLLVDRDDALAALTRLCAHLEPRGKLLVDLAHFRTADDATPGLQPAYFNPSLADGETVEDWSSTLASGARVTRRHQQYRLTSDQLLVRYHYETCWPGGRRERATMDMPLRIYEREQFLDIAHRAGLEAEAVYSDYQGRPHRRGSVRMIVMLRRPLADH